MVFLILVRNVIDEKTRLCPSIGPECQKANQGHAYSLLADLWNATKILAEGTRLRPFDKVSNALLKYLPPCFRGKWTCRVTRGPEEGVPRQTVCSTHFGLDISEPIEAKSSVLEFDLRIMPRASALIFLAFIGIFALCVAGQGTTEQLSSPRLNERAQRALFPIATNPFQITANTVVGIISVLG